MIDLKQLQTEVLEWAHRNFPSSPSHVPLVGMVEELGELSERSSPEDHPHLVAFLGAVGRLSHAHIKKEQGIRGTSEKHQTAKRDAIGDLMIYLAHYCGVNDLSLDDIVAETWGQVKQRDWQKNKMTGV